MLWNGYCREFARSRRQHRGRVQCVARTLGRFEIVFGLPGPDRDCCRRSGRHHAHGGQIGQCESGVGLAGFAKTHPRRNGSNVQNDRARSTGHHQCEIQQNKLTDLLCDQPIQKQKRQSYQQEYLLNCNDQCQRPDDKTNIGVNHKHRQQARPKHRQTNRFIDHRNMSHG